MRTRTYMLDIGKVQWPLSFVLSEQGIRAHILEPAPFPSGKWDVLCHSVNWTSLRPPISPDDAILVCSRCLGAAQNFVRNWGTEVPPEHLYVWFQDLTAWLHAYEEYKYGR